MTEELEALRSSSLGSRTLVGLVLQPRSCHQGLLRWLQQLSATLALLLGKASLWNASIVPGRPAFVWFSCIAMIP